MKLLNCMIFFFFFFGQDSELNPLWDWDTPHHRNATPQHKALSCHLGQGTQTKGQVFPLNSQRLQ